MTSVGVVSAPDVLSRSHSAQTVDARPRVDFEAGHIPRSIWLGWEDWCDPAPVSELPVLGEKGYWGALRQARAGWFAEKLTKSGLRSCDPIVVYADGPQSRGREGRIAWMLLYLGAESVSLLDGGWQAWLQAGGGIEQDHTTVPESDFRVSFQTERRCSVAQLADLWEDPSRSLVVDTRSLEEFVGDGQEYLPRRGHIPGAVPVPFAILFDHAGHYLDRSRFIDMLPPPLCQAGAVIAYCEVGVRAALFALLYEVHTGQVVSVCDGSVVEWALDSQLPLVDGPANIVGDESRTDHVGTVGESSIGESGRATAHRAGVGRTGRARYGLGLDALAAPQKRHEP